VTTGSLLLAIAALAAATFFFLWLRQARAARTEATRADALAAELQQLRERLAKLEPYSAIPSVEQHVAALKHTAEIEASRIVDAAQQRSKSIDERIEKAEEQAEIIKARARRQADESAEEARRSAAKILQQATADKEALDLSSAAMKAEAAELERTLVALRNIVDGYGDQYIVPTYTLLDELADDFGYDEAGAKHKEFRTQVRRMTQERRGGECDYVEANRRDTAITFVLDAFNGKVDSIISDVKADNFGTLAQKIRDARQVVNRHGAAFRNARISDEFMNLRIEELRWSCTLVALKEKEREEQRALRERIREEERAQKELDRALKDAAKEEESLLKAMEKVKADLERAADADRQKYEAKLFDLELKLRDAEAKSKKAISMAQLTKAGHVYIISNIGSFGEEVFKIGLTRRLEPMDRVRELGDASVPFEFDVHAMIQSDNAPALETELHKRFLRKQVNKVNPRKEFFRVQLTEIRTAVEALGCQAHWSMTAAARSFRESMAIEKALAEKRIDEKEWVKQQLEGATSSFDDEIEEAATSKVPTRRKSEVLA
jgi:hypothetical protein